MKTFFSFDDGEHRFQLRVSGSRIKGYSFSLLADSFFVMYVNDIIVPFAPGDVMGFSLEDKIEF